MQAAICRIKDVFMFLNNPGEHPTRRHRLGLVSPAQEHLTACKEWWVLWLLQLVTTVKVLSHATGEGGRGESRFVKRRDFHSGFRYDCPPMKLNNSNLWPGLGALIVCATGLELAAAAELRDWENPQLTGLSNETPHEIGRASCRERVSSPV